MSHSLVQLQLHVYNRLESKKMDYTGSALAFITLLHDIAAVRGLLLSNRLIRFREWQQKALVPYITLGYFTVRPRLSLYMLWGVQMKRPDQIAKSSGTIVNIKLYCSVNSRHASGGGGDSQWARPQSFKASPEAVYLGIINTLTEDYSRLDVMRQM